MVGDEDFEQQLVLGLGTMRERDSIYTEDHGNQGELVSLS